MKTTKRKKKKEKATKKMSESFKTIRITETTNTNIHRSRTLKRNEK